MVRPIIQGPEGTGLSYNVVKQAVVCFIGFLDTILVVKAACEFLYLKTMIIL